MAEDEANSVLSNEEGSSSDERPQLDDKSPASQPPKKRKREKHDKTSYAHLISSAHACYAIPRGTEG
jgi:hypothetical protein